MASPEAAPQVSILALARNIRNGGNTSENRQLGLKIVSQTETYPSRFFYRSYILSEALESGWRKLGLDERTVLDAEVLAPKPAVLTLNVVTSGLRSEFHPLVLVA